MDEKKLVVFWYKRFNQLNKGILRMLIVIALLGFFSSLVVLGLVLDDNVTHGDGTLQLLITITITWILGTVFFYWVFWSIVNVILWIYDGFKSNQ